MRKLYLSSWINFGKYRRCPANLKTILDTEEGRKWFRWLKDNTYNFEFDHTVLEYLELTGRKCKIRITNGLRSATQTSQS